MENQNVFKPGDVVQLKSGGPLMTVSALSPSSKEDVWVNYFDNSGKKLRSALVATVTLQHSTNAFNPSFRLEPYQSTPAYPFLGSPFISSTVRAINAASQADGCADPGDVHH